MRTTIEIADVIVERARTLAAREGTTLAALVEDGLRQVLRSRREARNFRLRDASVEGQGMQAEFQSADWERILDTLSRDVAEP